MSPIQTQSSRKRNQPSPTTLNSYHTAEDRGSPRYFSCRGRAATRELDYDVHRAGSLTSIQKAHTRLSAERPRRVYSLQSLVVRKSSITFTDSLPGTPRRVTVTNFNDLKTSKQPYQEPLCVDLQDSHHVNFILPASATTHQPALENVLSRSLTHRKSHTYASLRCKPSVPALVRSKSAKDLARLDGPNKIPLYVPSRIIKPEDQMSPDSAVGISDSLQVFRPLSEGNLSDSSDWSTMVQLGAQGYQIVQPECGTAGDGKSDLLSNASEPEPSTSPAYVPLRITSLRLDGKETAHEGQPDQEQALQLAEKKNMKCKRGARLRRKCSSMAVSACRLLRKSKKEDTNTEVNRASGIAKAQGF